MTEFEFVFGPRPFGPKDFSMKQKQMVWDREKEQFDKIVEVPWAGEALELYAEIGIGMPVGYQKKGSTRVLVAFPEARYSKLRYVPIDTAALFPGVVWRTWHLASIADGWYVPEVSDKFPASVLTQNETNRQKEM